MLTKRTTHSPYQPHSQQNEGRVESSLATHTVQARNTVIKRNRKKIKGMHTVPLRRLLELITARHSMDCAPGGGTYPDAALLIDREFECLL